jgi:CO/xanthine dehydrogenase FAD-binding subunit
MKPAAFKYIEADSEAAVCAAMAEYGGEARLLAGGQSLVPMMNFRLASPAVLVDLNPVATLDHITTDAVSLTIGAMVRHAALEDSAQIAKRCPLLHAAIGHVAHRAVRNRGTLGGSLALAYPGAELPLALVALDAEVCLKAARGERTMRAENFIRGALDTAIAEDEYVKSVQILPPPDAAKSSFVEASRRHGDFALAAAAVVIDVDQAGEVTFARAAVSGGTGAPVRLGGLEKALLGTGPQMYEITALARGAGALVEGFSDHHYPEDYRKHLLRTVLQRALNDCCANGGHFYVQ